MREALVEIASSFSLFLVTTAAVLLWWRFPPSVAWEWWRRARRARQARPPAAPPMSEHRLAIAGVGFVAFDPREERTIEFVSDRTFGPRVLSVPSPLSDGFAVLDIAIAGRSLQSAGGLMLVQALGAVGYCGEFPDVHEGDTIAITVANLRPFRAYFCAMLVGIEPPGIGWELEQRWVDKALRRALSGPHAAGAGLVPRGLLAAEPLTREAPPGGPVSEASERGDDDDELAAGSGFRWRH